MAGNKPLRILLLPDSRGFKVKESIQGIMRGRNIPLIIEVRAYSGATIEEVTTAGLFEANYRSYDQIYLLAGVNNMTTRLGYRNVKPNFTSWSGMIRNFMIEFHVARTRLYRLTDCVIVCDLIAMHLGTYNKNGNDYPVQQAIINNATLRINEYVKEMNYNAFVYSP